MNLKTTLKYVQKADQLRRSTRAATRKWLYRVGGYARRVARNSLKLAKPKRSDEELTDYELDRWVVMNRWREKRGLQTPARFPDRVSKPGRPPLIHYRTSPLKTTLHFNVDADAEDVVIGPMRFGKGASHEIEKKRPFMGAAQDKTAQHMAKWWLDAIT